MTLGQSSCVFQPANPPGRGWHVGIRLYFLGEDARISPSTVPGLEGRKGGRQSKSVEAGAEQLFVQ